MPEETRCGVVIVTAARSSTCASTVKSNARMGWAAGPNCVVHPVPQVSREVNGRCVMKSFGHDALSWVPDECR